MIEYLRDILDAVVVTLINFILRLLPRADTAAILMYLLIHVDRDTDFNIIVDTARARRAFKIQREAARRV